MGVLCVVFHFSTPLYIYRREPRPREESSAVDLWQTDILIQLASSTCPIQVGGAHGQVGRPCRSAGLPVGPPTFLFGPWVPSWAHLSLAWGLASVMSVSCSGGPSNPYFDTCHVLIHWNVVSWIKPHHYTAKSARNHLHTF